MHVSVSEALLSAKEMRFAESEGRPSASRRQDSIKRAQAWRCVRVRVPFSGAEAESVGETAGRDSALPAFFIASQCSCKKESLNRASRGEDERR